MLSQIGLPELLIIALIVLMVFGVGRINKVAGELGSGINAFRKGLKGDLDENTTEEKEEEK